MTAGRTSAWMRAWRVRSRSRRSSQSLEEASRFFEAGSLGYSATPDAKRFHGLSLRCDTWTVEPLDVEEVVSSFYDNRLRFPEGSATFDCALLMRGIAH